MWLALRLRVRVPEGFFSEDDRLNLTPSEMREAVMASGAELFDLLGGWGAILATIEPDDPQEVAPTQWQPLKREAVIHALENCPSLAAAARHLGIHATTLCRWRKRLGLEFGPRSKVEL